MKSKANIKSHPLHPILVAFPIAFFTGALIFDLLGFIDGKAAFILTGEYLEVAGLISAVLAAVPGFIDYIYTVPPKSTAKSRATKHALINTAMLILFGAALLLRQESFSALIIAIETGGVVLLTVAGWMGGTLVHRNQIGVDIRYAHAGKWSEEYFTESGNIEVASQDELKVNQMKLLHMNDKRIVLGKTEKGYVAFDDHCTHRGGSLAGGSMICGTVQCPWHGSQFDTATGEVKAGPAKDKIMIYTISERNGKVYLDL